MPEKILIDVESVANELLLNGIQMWLEPIGEDEFGEQEFDIRVENVRIRHVTPSILEKLQFSGITDGLEVSLNVGDIIVQRPDGQVIIEKADKADEMGDEYGGASSSYYYQFATLESPSQKTEIGISLSGLYQARRSLVNMLTENPEIYSPESREVMNKLIADIEEFRRVVEENIEKNTASPRERMSFHLMSIDDNIEGKNYVEEITEDDLRAYANYMMIRREIGRMAPDHILAIAQPKTIQQTLDDFEDASINFMKGYQMAAMWPPSVKETIRHIFNNLTSTRVEDLDAAMTSKEVYDYMIRRVNNGDAIDHSEQQWANIMCERVRESLQNRLNRHYQPDLHFFEDDGCDILLVKDEGGCFIYSWPSETRRLTVEKDNNAYPTLSVDQIPTEDQLAEAYRALDELVAQNVVIGAHDDMLHFLNDDEDENPGPTIH